MVVKGVLHNSVARNGVASFILPCYKVQLNFCNWGGSSQGMREFLTSDKFTQIAREYPQVQFEIIKKSGHPVLKGFYGSNNTDYNLSNKDNKSHIRSNSTANIKPICVKNLTSKDITQKLSIILSSSGTALKKHNYNVESLNDSIRGVWSPLHYQRITEKLPTARRSSSSRD